MSDEGRYTVQFVGNCLDEGHTVYIIKVTNPAGKYWNIQKRYREIRELNDSLRLKHGDTLPTIPGKRLFGNQDPVFIAQRQQGLEQYLDGVLLIEREPRSPELIAFLGAPQPDIEKQESSQHINIHDAMLEIMMNLTTPTQPLDEQEMEVRLKKYDKSLRLAVHSQPVDPTYLRAAGLGGPPAPLSPVAAARFDALRKPPRRNAEEEQILDDMLNGLHRALQPSTPFENVDDIIAPFPQLNALT
eukprot:TRINITY_DN55874_c0_g1_i1.p2 TRINITY_DN55874_c0_g1~~TRINITY_DN55874_c0_g1_i1.p2  ORF type:complete len:244 (+),score=63.99 TRINITY_DN55874_c0_g1_i1:64-795(+)